ncbi:hypothetical protein [Photobacterium kishitanii]|uniref:Uncharacterized protein n=1 Tax=Photobacterium kishitanii TaxID=318456 RepID=A0A2T3KM96_9GAMM|nr:hypothetical protein [Photobacterium kishitanii]PSV00904.1 hypothetical protein C9J27_02435 [Photobacterium kishitanii]
MNLNKKLKKTLKKADVSALILAVIFAQALCLLSTIGIFCFYESTSLDNFKIGEPIFSIAVLELASITALAIARKIKDSSNFLKTALFWFSILSLHCSEMAINNNFSLKSILMNNVDGVGLLNIINWLSKIRVIQSPEIQMASTVTNVTLMATLVVTMIFLVKKSLK